MCGIVGIMNFGKQAIDYKDLSVFQQLLVADTARGLDGTGIIKVGETGRASYRKIAGTPFDLIYDKRAKDWFEQAATKEFTRFLVGHNRYATKGGVSTNTAHPFTHGKITMVHNGTVSSGEMPELKTYPVDSEAICAAVADRGIEKAIQEFSGPFCLVWYDAATKELNMLRNHGRPLFVAQNTHTDVVMFGSEKKMLEWVADRNQYYFNTIRELPAHHLMSWNIHEPKPKIKSLSHLLFTHSSGYGSFEWDDDTRDWKSTSCATPTSTTTPVKDTPPVTPFPTSASAAAGGTISGTLLRDKPQQLIQLDKWKVKETMYFNLKNFTDMKPNDKGVTRVMLEGEVENWPNLRVRATCAPTVIDDLVKADCIKGTIGSIYKSDEIRDDGKAQYVMWVTFVEPVVEIPKKLALVGPITGLPLDIDDQEATAALLKAAGVSVVH